MTAIAWILLLFLIVRNYSNNPKISVIYFSSWGILITNYALGPLIYPEAKISFLSIATLALSLFFFFIGYFSSSEILGNRVTMVSDISESRERFLNTAGAAFAVSWVIGGLIYALPFIASLDLYGLRTSFVDGEKNVPLFSQIGSVFSGLSWIIISRISINRGAYSLKSLRITLLSLLLIPIFMAGRQIYMQLIVMLLIGWAVARKYRIPRSSRLLDASFLIKQAAVMAVLLISLITVIRFAGESLVYDTKLDQFSRISGSDLNSSYGHIFEVLPNWISDVVVEFNYYFSAQLVNFLERISAIGAPVLDFRILEKSPFVKNNINKICYFAQITCFDHKDIGYTRTISDSAWGTVLSTNFQLFGLTGTLLIGAIFGAICSISQKALNNSPKNFIAGNFFLANSVVAFYSVMDSIFNEIYFLIYYIMSFVLFMSSVRLRKVGHPATLANAQRHLQTYS